MIELAGITKEISTHWVARVIAIRGTGWRKYTPKSPLFDKEGADAIIGLRGAERLNNS